MQNIAKTRNNPGLHQKLVHTCPAGSWQEGSGCSVNDFPCISGIFRLFFGMGRGIIKL